MSEENKNVRCDLYRKIFNSAIEKSVNLQEEELHSKDEAKLFIDTMDKPRDYLQVFDLSEENGKQKIVHSQEQPEYMKEYLFETDTPFLCAKIFVIDDVTHSTMLFNYEY